MAAPISRAEGEDTLVILVDRPVSEERPTSIIWLTQSRSTAGLKHTVREHIANIPDLLKDAVVRLFNDKGRKTVSSPDSKVMAVNQTVVNRSVTKAFQSSAFHTTVKRAQHKCLAEPHLVNEVATRAINLPAFTIPLAKFVKNDVEKCSP